MSLNRWCGCGYSVCEAVTMMRGYGLPRDGKPSLAMTPQSGWGTANAIRLP